MTDKTKIVVSVTLENWKEVLKYQKFEIKGDQLLYEKILTIVIKMYLKLKLELI